MNDKDSSDLDRAFEFLRTFGENLSVALRRTSTLQQSSYATIHLFLALAMTLAKSKSIKLDELAADIRSMQKIVSSETNTEQAQKQLLDVADGLSQVAGLLSGDQGQSKDDADPQSPLAEFLKNWKPDKAH